MPPSSQKKKSEVKFGGTQVLCGFSIAWPGGGAVSNHALFKGQPYNDFLHWKTGHTTDLAGSAPGPSGGWKVTVHTASLVPETGKAVAQFHPSAWIPHSTVPATILPVSWPDGFEQKE